MIRPALAIALSNESRPASAVVLPAAGTAPDGELERLGDEIAERILERARREGRRRKVSKDPC